DDACPSTDRGQDVNQVGCAPNQLDDDGDNVSNADDLCPNTIINSDDIDSNGCAPYQRDTDEDGVNDADDICPNTAWLDAVNEEGCSAKQRDTDGDGPKDADDSCPLIPGSISGCPILTIDVLLEQAPSIDSQIANISISITCESACLMNVTDVSEVKLLDGPISNVSNSTYYIEYSGYNETLFFNIEVRITGGEGFGSMWKVDELYVEFPAALMDSESWGDEGENPCDENCGGEQGDSQSASKNDDDGLKLDTGSIAMIAMLLLLNIGAIAAIMGARSRSKIKSHMREKSMQSFEQQLFQESVPSKNIKKFDDDIVDFIPPKKENNELPNMEDLLE
ncbi:MAG: hypothetical protein QF440_06710, partial [Candidatus Thalassarchaeaceae archaeon]|nr:hypothetical protein [Candidatus Thalassarchaeaceae archaeon]